MVRSSLSILFSVPASFPSSCAKDSTSTASSPAKLNSFKPSPRFYKPVSTYCDSSPPIRRIGVRAKLAVDEDGSLEKFMQNNSAADFTRYKEGGSADVIGELQTAVVTYGKKYPWSLFPPFLQVDLVSAIHIADREYFATLQKKLEPYDCVLYEMVASRNLLKGRKSPSGMKTLEVPRSRGFDFDIIGFIQRLMSRLLMVDFQLDCLDFQAEGWYHADLDCETFELLQRKKGETVIGFARKMTLKSAEGMLEPDKNEKELGPWRSKLLWASRSLPMPLVGLFLIESVCFNGGTQASEYEELEALSRLDFVTALKLFLAKTLASGFSTETADLDEESVIVGERNKAATEVLQRAIDEGHKKIAILYGSGHMPDLGRRLREEFNLTPTRVQWITAWSIKKKNVTSSSLPFLKTMAEVSGWPLDRYQTVALLIFSSVLASDLLVWELFFDSLGNWISDSWSEIFQYVNGARVML